MYHHRFYITKIAFNIMMHEIFCTPMWIQPNYQKYKDYFVEREKPLPQELMRQAK